jgi:uncharacterized protein YlxW (UPF0749 family)
VHEVADARVAEYCEKLRAESEHLSAQLANERAAAEAMVADARSEQERSRAALESKLGLS